MAELYTCHKNKISRRRESDLQKTNKNLLKSPNNPFVRIQNFIHKNVSSFSRRSNLDLVIALNLCIQVTCFSPEPRMLLQIWPMVL